MSEFLPYGRQSIDDDDIAAVVDVLRSDWLTTGPKVNEFERDFAEFTHSAYAVAISSGTAALHAAMYALGIKSGDEVIVPALTFAATANCVLYCGGTPVFADILPDTLLIDPECVQACITERTKAIIAVDYAGQPCDYAALRAIANQHGLALVADACHAVGGSLGSVPVGNLADLSTFSFHPVKNLATGEGGMITTNNSTYAQRMRIFRNHGITTDHRQREALGSWFYEMVDLGFNYRMTDFQCALGISQLRKLPRFIAHRQMLAAAYDRLFLNHVYVSPLKVSTNCSHAYHLYVVKVNFDALGVTRQQVFQRMRASGIGVNVHYIPVYLHPYYRSIGYASGLCPVAEQTYEQILSLPIFSAMPISATEFVAEAFGKALFVST